MEYRSVQTTDPEAAVEALLVLGYRQVAAVDEVIAGLKARGRPLQLYAGLLALRDQLLAELRELARSQPRDGNCP